MSTKNRALSRIDSFTLRILADIFEYPFTCWIENDFLLWPQREEVPMRSDIRLKKELEQVCSVNHLPVIYFENEFVFYGVFLCDPVFFCIGPLVRITVDKLFHDTYCKEHMSEQSLKLPQGSLNVVSKILTLMFHQYKGKKITYEDISIKGREYQGNEWVAAGDLENYQLMQSEHEREHGIGRSFENSLLDIVRQGDVETAKQLMNGEMPDMDMIGVVADDNSKQTEYLTVVLFSLLTRAAIDGGVSPEEAYELGDVYMQKLEKCNGRVDMYSVLGFNAVYEFTEKVNRRNRQSHKQPHIEKCKDYIAKHIRKDIKVGDIAPNIGVSRTYLAHKFKEVEGITVQQYISKERCDHAANLLKYSDYPIALISEYFCFSSQSYFGKCFKEIYGVSPKEYRNINFRIKK